MAELEKLGRYELRRVLGKGAMGVVYEGHDPVVNRQVAIKTILRNAAIDAETAAAYSERFKREAQAAGRLNHPHIVHVYDFAEEGDVAYLVMEYIQGRELRSFFDAKERFEPGEAVRIMAELLDALGFAHEAGVIHRDVKPANVMLDMQRRVKLADFGVARILDSDRSMAGTMVGTPAFMSPEQIKGGKVDRRTDIFSAGLVLYQLLTGEQPFKGEGAWTVAKKIVEDDPPLPSSLGMSIAASFDAVVRKALAKLPPQRFSDARQFADALREALKSRDHATPQVPVATPTAGPKASDTELEFWRAIQASTDAAEYEFYLEQFPEGAYAALARHKIARLRESAEAEGKARAEAEAKARREREAKARREAAERARQAEALARVKPREATVALETPGDDRKRTVTVAGVAVASGIILIAALYPVLKRSFAPQPSPPIEKPGAAKAEVSAADVEKIKRETEERIRREYAEKSAAEQAALAKAAADKDIAEKAVAARVAAEKAVKEKAAAEKAKIAAEKAAAEKALREKAESQRIAAEKEFAEKAASEKAAAEKAAAEKASAERAAAEKAAAEQAAAERAAAQKAASAVTGATGLGYDGSWRGQGDIWRISLSITGKRVEGTVACFRRQQWSRSVRITGTIDSAGKIEAQIAGKPEGWAPRYIGGQLPEIGVYAYATGGKLDCFNGTAKLEKK